MISLRDKLKKASAVPRATAHDVAADTACHVCETVYPLYEVPCVDEGVLRMLAKQDARVPLDALVFLDTETTGLSGGAGTLAFLVGIGRVEARGFVVRQYLMRDYPQETDMLSRTLGALSGAAALVTYNGKSFDAPLLASRMLMKRMRMPELPHIDLLHTARAVWKMRMPNFKLKTLEEYLLGIERHDDIPGSEIPAVWFNAVKSGDYTRVDDVLRHNAQDIRSLLDVLMRLSGALSQPEAQSHPADLYSLGRLFERRRDLSRAKVLYSLATPTYLGAGARLKLSMILKREGDYVSAEALLARIAVSGQHRLFAHIELAKIYEHKMGRLADALSETDAAMTIATSNDERGALIKRRERLLKKLAAVNTEGRMC